MACQTPIRLFPIHICSRCGRIMGKSRWGWRGYSADMNLGLLPHLVVLSLYIRHETLTADGRRCYRMPRSSLLTFGRYHEEQAKSTEPRTDSVRFTYTCLPGPCGRCHNWLRNGCNSCRSIYGHQITECNKFFHQKFYKFTKAAACDNRLKGQVRFYLPLPLISG
jgi:hypothetical protein